MKLTKKEKNKINEFFKKEKGSHFSEAFKRFKPPFNSNSIAKFKK